ncbi:MAG: dihydroxy-acid dehydratase, partial [Corallococcus sp.]|nr:dihydroxy-acid dehydratase [Corallococcus sp.]
MFREMVEQLDRLPQKIMANALEIDVKNPLVGIFAADNQFTLRNNLKTVIERVKSGIESANANAKIVHIPTIDVTAFNATASAKYDLPSRDAIANTVELLTYGDQYDAIVFVSDNVNINAGLLLSAIRLNIPCL